MAGRGIITLQVGIHGIPVTMEQSVYDSLGAGALANYNTFGLDNRDRYYYRRVYLGCVRANDFLTSHPKWDGATLVVTGGSQGGALRTACDYLLVVPSDDTPVIQQIYMAYAHGICDEIEQEMIRKAAKE